LPQRAPLCNRAKWNRKRGAALDAVTSASPEGIMPNPDQHERPVRVWFRLIRLEARMQSAINERLRRIGISIPQCDVLTTLTEAEGVSQQDLAKRLYVTKGNISGLLDRLESAGFVERRSTASDRRQYSIYLTQSGRTMAEKAIAVQHRWIASTFGRMSEPALEALETQLIALRDLVREQEKPPAARIVRA
jgi:MarR family transcriptional regulator, organic hydroperoxide resistance regulator